MENKKKLKQSIMEAYKTTEDKDGFVATLVDIVAEEAERKRMVMEEALSHIPKAQRPAAQSNPMLPMYAMVALGIASSN